MKSAEGVTQRTHPIWSRYALVSWSHCNKIQQTVWLKKQILGLRGGSVKGSAWQCRRHRFDPWSRKTPHAAEQLSPHHNYWACALEAKSCNYWVLEPWSVCSTREATATRSLCITAREGPLLTATKESPLAATKTSARPKINKEIIIINRNLFSRTLRG